MSIVRTLTASALALVAAGPAAAALDLSRYSVALQTGINFSEASGVAYNYDKNVLFLIDDEGDDAGEFSLIGQKLTADRFQSNYRDLEGVTYIGGGRYVVANERSQGHALIEATNTTPGTFEGLPSNTYTGQSQARTYSINNGANVGNNGLEGVAFDPVTGGYLGVKQGGQGTDQRVYLSTINFDAPVAAGSNVVQGSTTDLFNPASLGLLSLSDIAALAANPNFAGTDYYNNLLILSAGDPAIDDPFARTGLRLLEVTRTGTVLSSFDLGALSIKAIEGVTIGTNGNIYLVGEVGGVTPGTNRTSGLVVLAPTATAPVPEPATWAMMVLGFGATGLAARRRRATARA
jgi:uncharacterized protein YjiK